jgi:hypothetical protein
MPWRTNCAAQAAMPRSRPRNIRPCPTACRPPWADGVVPPAIEFLGDVAHNTVVVRTSAGYHKTYDLDQVDVPEVKTEIDEWLGHIITASPL